MRVSLLHFKAQDPWVARILQGCKSQWWVKNCIRVPLLQEVAQLIRAKKGKPGAKFADAILPLQVRGKVLWFHNSQKCVTLALREDKVGKSTDVDQGEVQGEGEGKDHAIEDLRWFLTQLDNDILSMQPAEPATIPVKAKAKAPVGRAAGSAPPDLKDMVASCLELLRSDPACKTAAFHTSKSSFSVVRKEGKARKSFRVLGCKRKREAAATSDSKDLQDAFDRSVQRARTWMAGPAHGAAEDPEDSDEEDQSEHVPDSQRAEDPAGAGGSD